MRALLLGLLLLSIFAFFAWRTWGPSSAVVGPLPAGPDSVGTGLKAVRLYFAAPAGDRLVSEPRELPEAQSLHDRVVGLVRELDRGPAQGGVAALPTGTSVLQVFLDDSGLMTLNLSRAFQQNFHGGSGAEYLAIATLVRTVSVNVPEAKRVMLLCGGAPIPTLGGHLPLDRPLDVAEYP